MSVEILSSVETSNSNEAAEIAEARSAQMAAVRQQWREQLAARTLLAHIAGVEPTVQRTVPCTGITAPTQR